MQICRSAGLTQARLGVQIIAIKNGAQATAIKKGRNTAYCDLFQMREQK